MSPVKGWILRRWPSLISATLLLLAFPPFDFWPLVFVAIAPLLWQLRTVNAKEAWRIGYFFGLVYFGGQIVWLGQFVAHWTDSPWLAVLPWAAGTAFVALFYGWVCRLIQRCFRSGWVWLIPVVWTGMEIIRSYVPVFAFPWGIVATPLYTEPALIQVAHFGTIYLVSAWILTLNLGISLSFDAARRSSAKAYFVGFIVLLGVSLCLYTQSSPAVPFVVIDGQPAVDQAYGYADIRAAEIARNVDELIDQAISEHAQLLVLPEGIGDDDHYPPEPPFRLDPRMPMVFGGQRITSTVNYQTAFSFDGLWHHADKTRLVIFGEFVPGRSLFPGLAKAFDLPSGDLSAGVDGVKPLDVAGIRVGPILCFEGLFPDISYRQALNGSRLLTVMSIDDWYMGTNGPEQLMAASIFRAVETGLPLVRSASLGYTLVLDAHGRIVSRVPLAKIAGLKTTVMLPRKTPVFPLLPLFPLASGLLTLTLPLWLRRPETSAETSVPDSAS